jgi:hypothetical protein
VATSVSGRPDDLAWRCSSDTFDLNGRAFENSENWAVLSTEGDKPSPRFDVINHLKNSLKCKRSCSVLIIISFCTEAFIKYNTFICSPFQTACSSHGRQQNDSLRW